MPAPKGNQYALGNKGGDSKYESDFAGQAEKLCELGATDAELADFFGVNTTTIWRWKSRYEEFCNALKVGKEAADRRIEHSLYQKALGYSFDSEKVFNANGKALRVPIREHLPPDTTAAIFWLKNRKPEEWRDKQDIDHTHKIEEMSDEEYVRRTSLIAERAKRRREKRGKESVPSGNTE